jgi:hypothetical protein
MSRPDRLRLLSGVLLCFLLFLFSTSAKLATYHHGPAEKQIAATKLLQKSVAPAPSVAPQVPIASPVWLAFLGLHVPVLATTSATPRPDRAQPVDSWFSPFLAVRPPPVA